MSSLLRAANTSVWIWLLLCVGMFRDTPEASLIGIAIGLIALVGIAVMPCPVEPEETTHEEDRVSTARLDAALAVIRELPRRPPVT